MKLDNKRYAIRTVRDVNKHCRINVQRERYKKLPRAFSRFTSALHNISRHYFAGRNRGYWLPQFLCAYGLKQDSVCTQEQTPPSSGEIFKLPSL